MNDADVEMIDSVYAATTKEGSLSEAVQKYLHLQGDPGGALFHYDSIMDEASALEVVTVDEKLRHVVQGVFDNYTKSNGAIENPLISIGLEDLMAGKILVSDDVMPFAEFSQTDYYKAVFEPLGIRWSMGWVAVGRGQKWMTFTSSRDGDSGEYVDYHLDRGRLFQRHMARAIHILELIDEAREVKSIFEKSIEKLPQGIILMNDARKIVFCNGVASQLISKSRSLSDGGNKLTVGATAHERGKFDQWWNILVRAQSSDGACYSDTPMDPVWEIDVSRVASGENRSTGGRRWMLTLKQYPDGDQVPLDFLIKRFGLTKSEADVCNCLCSNGDAVSTAKVMGLSPNTVRTHLKSAFRKTDTRNQVELAVKLVSRK